LRHRRLAVLVAAVLGLLMLPAASDAAPATPAAQARGQRTVCGPEGAGTARCHAHVTTRGKGDPTPLSGPTPYGLSPAQIKTAYSFPTAGTAGAGKTIAIVDAYDNPAAESDLNVFSRQYGLPECTTANGCFTKVSQTGTSKYPRKDAGWALEIALDIQWAHAIAPGAKILLVEASSNSFANLLAAEDYAKTHAQYVSNSWGASEFSGETSYDARFVQSGVSFFVSAGDNGTPAEYPSSSRNVISVGGTRLTGIGTASFSETGWTDGGGGCSLYETAPAAQSAFSGYAQANCGGKRATPDVSLDADPASGVSVYMSTSYQGQTGWYAVGGTSASSPMWAGRSAVAGAVVNHAYVYGNSITFRDITSGNNGAPCLVGFDLCTGRGSWVG
jgi:subtilase family serine protease